MTKQKIYIEFDELDKILNNIKIHGKQTYEDDSEKRKIIEDIFFEIDRALIIYEDGYEADETVSKYFNNMKNDK